MCGCCVAGQFPEDLACLASNDGWLTMTNLEWVANTLNSQSPDTRSFVQHTAWLQFDRLEQQQNAGKLRGIMIQHVCAVLNVMKGGGRVFISDEGRPGGQHWTLAIVHLDKNEITYCDSLAWGLPEDVDTKLAPLLRFFRKHGELL